MELKNGQLEEVSTNIQLGIFIPKDVQIKKKKKGDFQATEVRMKGQKIVKEEENAMTVPSSKDVEKTSRKRAVKFEEVEGRLDGHLKKNKISTSEHMSLEEVSGRTEQKKVRTRRRIRRAKNVKRKLSQAGLQLCKTGVDRETALDYLRQWDSDKSKWAFRKKSQYWLLQNACDKSQIPKAEFKTLLRYIDGLQGNQRQVSVARMQDIIDRYQHTEDVGDESAGGSSGTSKRMYKRAVAILRVLA